MSEEIVTYKVKERIVLRKYSGDPPFTEDMLIEAVVTENGQVIDRWHKGDSRPPPED
jgi:hypothetical protein